MGLDASLASCWFGGVNPCVLLIVRVGCCCCACRCQGETRFSAGSIVDPHTVLVTVSTPAAIGVQFFAPGAPRCFQQSGLSNQACRAGWQNHKKNLPPPPLFPVRNAHLVLNSHRKFVSSQAAAPASWELQFSGHKKIWTSFRRISMPGHKNKAWCEKIPHHELAS